MTYNLGYTSTKIIFAGTLFFCSQTVHNIMALVEKFQRTQQENRLCKQVYTRGLLNSTACVNFPFTQAVYDKNRVCKYH